MNNSDKVKLLKNIIWIVRKRKIYVEILNE
jgi:hypothetical protein